MRILNTRSILGLAVCAALAAGCGRPARPPESAAPVSAPAPSVPAPGGSELLAGLGDVHHPITTTSPEAQKFFDQGMALAFGFNHEAAIRSFERAQRLDPKAPMPYWGKAWALGTNYNMPVDDARETLAFQTIAEARAIAAGPERDYVDAMAQRYSLDMHADRAALERKYSAAMEALSKKYPDDLDAATLYAESLMNLNPWKLWSSGRPAPGTDRIVAVLESVLMREPNHLGANHFYIHAVEASPNPSRALQSAARLEKAAPLSGHLVHMPAHIYGRTGDHAAAAKANTDGAAADVKYLETAPPDSLYGMMYYSHNLQFLTDDEMMQGRFADAQPPAALLAKRLDGFTAMMPMLESLLLQPVQVLQRFNKHEEILRLPAPPADRRLQTAWYHFARGVALAQTGRPAEAVTEQAAFSHATAQIPVTALWGGSGFTSAHTAMEIAGLILDARIAWSQQQASRSIQFWQRAVAAADALPYDEPPDWYYPVRESLGAALLLAGKPLDAEKVFREDLNRNPRNPRSLFGLQAALAKEGRSADAAWVQRAFERAWRNADTTLTLEGL
jgi:tetratricopeptide (TPR) repeat protein